MSILEKSVSDLADALEALESTLEGQLNDVSAKNDLIDAARRQARAAQGHTASAGSDLSGAISDLKILLDDHKPESKG